MFPGSHLYSLVPWWLRFQFWSGGPTGYCIDAGRAPSVLEAAQLAADDLAGAGQRQRIDIADLTRIFVGRQPHLHMVLDLASQLLARAPTVFQDQKRLDDLCALRIGHAYHRRHPHRRMTEQAVLDRSRPDPVAGAGDHVVNPADEFDVALRITASRIAGQQVLAGEFFLGGTRIVP